MQTYPEMIDKKSTKPQTAIRKVYEKPKLELMGDLRALTLGGSAGAGESGGKFPMTH